MMNDGNPLMEENEMRRLGKAAIAIPAWLCLWLVLAGADRGCFFVETDCAELDEQACLDDPECQPVYVYPNTYDDELGCGGDGTRCIGGEPVFDTCEAKPDCETLGEEACLSQGACQAIYGYSDDEWALNGTDSQPRCAPGTRCISPPETFLECLDADADPCAGLEEQACWQRPMCEAEYVADACLGCEAEYAGCHQREGECRTADDCYAVYFGDGYPECANFHFTCEAGACVEHCDDSGCKDDSECGADERCEIRCGNGWCEGVCIQDTEGCLDDGDCAEGEQCVFPNCDCLDEDPDCRENCLGAGVCLPVEEGCESDAECAEDEYCMFSDWCDEGWCGLGTCMPRQNGCEADDECSPGERCEVYCGNGWCEGQCVLSEFDCQVDGDCAEGQFCEPAPNVDCWFGEPCPGFCADGVWTFNEPIQCGGNPWELDAQENPDRYYECMLDMGASPTLEEICRVETFFIAQGIWLHDVRDVHTYDEVCASCACPRGDTIYALVAPYDLDRILEFGFMPN